MKSDINQMMSVNGDRERSRILRYAEWQICHGFLFHLWLTSLQINLKADGYLWIPNQPPPSPLPLKASHNLHRAYNSRIKPRRLTSHTSFAQFVFIFVRQKH